MCLICENAPGAWGPSNHNYILYCSTFNLESISCFEIKASLVCEVCALIPSSWLVPPRHKSLRGAGQLTFSSTVTFISRVGRVIKAKLCVPTRMRNMESSKVRCATPTYRGTFTEGVSHSEGQEYFDGDRTTPPSLSEFALERA